MALDTSIPLQVRPPQIESPQNVLMNAVRYQGAQGQLAEQQRAISERNALADVLRQPGTFGEDGRFSRSALPAIAAASPESVPQYAGLANQQDAVADQSEVRRMQLAKQSMQVQGQLLQGVRDESSYQAAKQQAQQYGIDVSQLPPNYDPAFVQQALARTMSQLDQFDMLYRQEALKLQQRRLEQDSQGRSAPQQSSAGYFQTDRLGNVTMVRGPDGQPLMPVALDAEGQARVKRATSEAQEIGKGAGELANNQQKKAVDAGSAIDLLDEASRLLPTSTGSAAGRMVDDIAGAAGVATEGAKSIAALQTIAGQLVSRMPRMEGPQSDKDVQLYKQMAGDLANPSIPVETRQAALAQIRRLNEKYAPAGRQGSAPATATQRQISRRGRLPDGRQVVEYTDGTREVVQ